MDLWLFPFDVQYCHLQMESFYYTREQVVLSIGGYYTSTNQSEQWNIELGENEIEEYQFFDEMLNRNQSHDVLRFHMVLTRKSLYHCLTIILPCMIVLAIQVTTFAVPLKQYVRLQLSFSSLLSFSVFLSVFQNELPPSSDNPSLIYIYISLMTVSIAIVTMCQALAIGFYEMAKSHKQNQQSNLISNSKSWTASFSQKITSTSNPEKALKSIATLFDRFGLIFFASFLTISPIVLFAMLTLL